MSSEEVRQHLSDLDLMRDEAALLLGVTTRTVTRWCEGEEITGPAEAALRAWKRLSERGFPWKPDAISVLEEDEDQIDRQRTHAMRFEEMLKRVESRGGPTHPWKVDTRRSMATFGASEVNYHKLANGGFSISSYRRTDRHADLDNDMPLIEDAAYCIAREFTQFGARAAALAEMAAYVREHSTISVRNGPKLPSPKEAAERKRQIEDLGERLAKLADAARDGAAAYAQYEEIQRELHSAGFFPLDKHVAAVARAFV